MSSTPQPPLGTPPGPPQQVVPAPAAAPRTPRRRSIFSGLLLIFLGVLFLLFRFDPHLRLGHLIFRYWPVVIIVWGIAKLVDHLAARHPGERATVLTGGEAALLVAVIFCLAGVGLADYLRHRNDFHFSFHPFAEHYTQSDELPAQRIPPNAHVMIQTDRGNITVHAGGGEELRVTVNKSASGPNRSAAEERMAGVKTVIEQSDGGFSVHPINQQDWEGDVEADLDIEVPKTASVSADSGHGDITIASLSGAVEANATNGDIDVHDAGSNVSVTENSGNVRISSVAGNVRVGGHGSEVDVSDVAGDAALDGEFFGPVRVRDVAKVTQYTSQRSALMLAHLTGRLELDSGELQVSDVAGPAKLATQNKDIDAEDVAGPLEIADSHGDITIRCSRAPTAPLSVNDESGEVNLTLPSNSNFQISAVSQSGEVDSEFEDPSLRLVNDPTVGRLSGKIGAGGPKITIVTSYGTISLHKGS
jgi:DUF4097 and DUF4098 domain-containing protein YvlB